MYAPAITKSNGQKCDEAVPCSACLRHGQKCSLLSASLSTSPSSESSRRKSTSIPPTSDDNISTSQNEYDLADLLLLHHFSIETAATFSKAQLVRDTWAKAVPSLAVNAEYVMRGILAVAAIHKVSLDPIANAHFHSIAIRHLNEGVALIRPLVADINKDNCVPMLAFSALASIFTFTQPLYYNDDEMPQKPIDQFTNTLHMFYGSKSIISQGHKPPPDNVIQPILEYRVEENFEKIPPRTRKRFEWLYQQIHELEDEHVLKTCKQSVVDLERAFAMVSCAAPDLEFGHVLRWTAVTSLDYLALLQQRCLPALGILAFFTAILLEDHGGWVFGAWQRRLRQEIGDVMNGTPWAVPLTETLPELDYDIRALF